MKTWTWKLYFELIYYKEIFYNVLNISENIIQKFKDN